MLKGCHGLLCWNGALCISTPLPLSYSFPFATRPTHIMVQCTPSPAFLKKTLNPGAVPQVRGQWRV